MNVFIFSFLPLKHRYPPVGTVHAARGSEEVLLNFENTAGEWNRVKIARGCRPPSAQLLTGCAFS